MVIPGDVATVAPGMTRDGRYPWTTTVNGTGMGAMKRPGFRRGSRVPRVSRG